MTTKIIYQSTVLNGVNKVGNLQKDANGYFEIVLGALNAYNSQGWYYSYEHAKSLFENSSELMRRISTGRLRGETGHPRFQPGMTQLQWFSRVNDLLEPNLCVHFKEVSLSFDGHKDEKGNPIILIMGRAKPSGANSQWLEKQFENPDEDVCFSIRSFTEDEIIGGRRTKMLKKIVTWDTVNEPGLSGACKYKTPSLESLGVDGPQADLEMSFFTDALRREIKSQPAIAGVSLESANAQLFSMIAEIEKPIKIFVPASMNW
jgi:hypothetical protein